MTTRTFLHMPARILERDLDGRVAIVTGATAGIGKAAASMLASTGCRVVMACRNEVKARRVVDEIVASDPGIDRHGVEFMKLDLADLESVRRFADAFEVRHDRLDFLVNNAGLGRVTSPKVTRDGVETIFQVNHLGHFLLTYLLVGMVVEHDARVVNVASHGHRLVRDPFLLDDVTEEMTGLLAPIDLYARSKLANVLFASELQRRLVEYHPNWEGDVFSLTPGRVRTEVWDKSFPFWARWYFRLVGPLIMKTAEQGAETVVWAALEPSLRGRGGAYLADCAIRTPSRLARDERLARRLWKRSEEILGVRFLSGPTSTGRS